MPKIIIEGIDGSGKSSLKRSLQELLPQIQIDAEFTAEPTDAARVLLRQAAANGTLHEEAATIFLNDRTELLAKLEPLLKNGKPVIFDRHLLSTIAYQGVKQDPVKIAKEQLERFAPADLTILLDISPEESLARLGDRDEAKKTDTSNSGFEQIEHLRATRKLYHRFLGLASAHAVVIDATRPANEVTAIAVDAIRSFLRGEKLPQSIFCVPRQVLVDEGLILESDADPESTTKCRLGSDTKPALERALAHGFWVERKLAEENPELKQIIPAIIVEDPQGNLLYYTRQGNEKRLHQKVSINLGGHIDPEDVADTNFLTDTDEENNGWNMVQAGATRELQEELGAAANHCPAPSLLGIINDDSDSVGQVHFGVVMRTKCRLALHLRHNEETGLIQTASPKTLSEFPNLEGWASAILQQLAPKRPQSHEHALATLYKEAGVGETCEQKIAFWKREEPSNIYDVPNQEMELRVREESWLTRKFPQDYTFH